MNAYRATGNDNLVFVRKFFEPRGEFTNLEKKQECFCTFIVFSFLLFSRSASTIDSWLGNPSGDLGNPRLEGKSLRCSFLVGNYLNVKFDFVLGKHVLLCIRLTQVNYLRRRKKSDTNVAQCTSDREAVKLFALGQLKHCCAGRCCQNSFNHCGHCVAGNEGKAYECSSPSLPFVK